LRAALASLAVVMAVALPARARAESPEAQVERLAAEAVNAYRGADYNRAIELLNKAYDIRQVPALLYNMAKAYDKLADLDHAADAYRRYVASLDPDPKLKAKAEARLSVIDELRRKNVAAERAVESAPRPRPAPSVESPPPRVEAPSPPPSPPLSDAEQIRDRLRRERQRDRLRARWVALGLGLTTVALGGTAIGLSANALSLQSQWQLQYGGDEDARRALKNSALLRAGLADGFYAGTAVFAAITGYFLYRGFRGEPSAPSLALGVTPAGAYIASEVHF
jgi:tetratricopeptide (TPR) repeat protein